MARSKAWVDLGEDELAARGPSRGAAAAGRTARETVAAFREVWGRRQGDLPIPGDIRDVVTSHLERVIIAQA